MSEEPDAADLPPGLALAWGDVPAGGRRGPKPAYSVAGVVEAAAALADRDGMGAVSMPAVARAMGVTANALYRYVSSKEELLVLLGEHGWGPPPAALGVSADWRTAAADWVQALVRRAEACPWVLDLPISGVPLTPGRLAWLEALMEALWPTGLDVAEILGCAQLLDGYARNTAQLHRDLRHGSVSGVPPAVVRYVEPRLRARGLRRVRHMLAMGTESVGNAPTTALTFGLDRILDGIETLIASGAAREP